MGIRSMVALVVAHDRGADPRQRDHKSVGQGSLGGDVFEVDAEVDDGLGNLRADTADDAIGAHEARSSDGFEQMLIGFNIPIFIKDLIFKIKNVYKISPLLLPRS